MKVQASGMTLTFTWSESKLLMISGAPAMFGLPAPATATLASPFSGVPVTKASFTGAIATATGPVNTLTATSLTGQLFVGQTISGAGVPTGTKITGLGATAGDYIVVTPSGAALTVTPGVAMTAAAYPVQGTDVLRIGGTTQNLDGGWTQGSSGCSGAHLMPPMVVVPR